jgi:hypothetical protein
LIGCPFCTGFTWWYVVFPGGERVQQPAVDQRNISVDIDRRRAFLMALAVAGTSTREPAKAQQRFDFDPIATAKLRAGEIAREISGSDRDTSVPEPSWDTIFNTGLLLQAGLRALLPIPERQGVALPGTPSPSDPIELIEAQENYKAVFESEVEATSGQKTIALKSIELASHQLEKEGYRRFSKTVSDWIGTQRR